MFGVLALDKPPGMTSRSVVNRISRVVGTSKVGHTGTLDPMATGVLLLAIGPATRLVEFSHAQNKSYRADFQLGQTSDTLDTDGQVTPVANAPLLDAEAFSQEMLRWIGNIEQVPPKYSAVHVGGKRAHELARQGTDFDLPARTVEIHAIELLRFDYPHLTLDITCGTGTYVRALGSDIARRLGSDAVMTRLVRTRIGQVQLADCLTLEQVVERGSQVEEQLLSPLTLVSTLPHLTLSAEHVATIRNGIPLDLPRTDSGPLAAIDAAQELVAILTRDGQRYRSLRVFQKASETHQPNANSKPHKPES